MRRFVVSLSVLSTLVLIFAGTSFAMGMGGRGGPGSGYRL